MRGVKITACNLKKIKIKITNEIKKPLLVLRKIKLKQKKQLKKRDNNNGRYEFGKTKCLIESG